MSLIKIARKSVAEDSNDLQKYKSLIAASFKKIHDLKWKLKSEIMETESLIGGMKQDASRFKDDELMKFAEKSVSELKREKATDAEEAQDSAEAQDAWSYRDSKLIDEISKESIKALDAFAAYLAKQEKLVANAKAALVKAKQGGNVAEIQWLAGAVSEFESELRKARAIA